MAGRVGRLVGSLAEFLRVMGSSAAGFVPPLRSKAGTFGTQRAEGRRVADERAKYPSD